jgi:hypothetical protein
MSDMLAAALGYAMADVAVLPLHTPRSGRCSCSSGRGCPHPGKHPRTVNGKDDASTDVAVIGEWWARWPDANPGIVVPDGFAIIDVDRPDAMRGVPLPPTLIARTARGGHYWYTLPAGAQPRPRPGADVRLARKHYVVAPPSLHASGVRYEWLDRFDLALAQPLPDAWAQPVAAADDEPRERYRLPAVIETGDRHSELVRYGGALRAYIEDDALVRAALADANRTRCREPLPARELDDLVADVLRRYRPAPTVILDLRDDESEPDAEPPGTASWTRLPPEERVTTPPRLAEPYICDSRTMWFGAGGVGKGALAAAAAAALATGDDGYLPGCRIVRTARVGILDYEDNRDEWADRLQRLGLAPASMPYLAGRAPLTRRGGLDRARAWVRDEGVELVLVDSAIPAAGVADAMKPEGPTAYYLALAELAVPSWTLAHVPKAQAAADHPFGSTYWSTPQRLMWRVEKVETADAARHVVRLVNTKHSRWPWAPSTVLHVEWGEWLRVRPTGVLLTDDAFPLIDRIVAALTAQGRPLTADELAQLVDSTAQAIREQARRHPHRVSPDGGRPQRYVLP